MLAGNDPHGVVHRLCLRRRRYRSTRARFIRSSGHRANLNPGLRTRALAFAPLAAQARRVRAGVRVALAVSDACVAAKTILCGPTVNRTPPRRGTLCGTCVRAMF
ncbi:hypothetical protein GCM10010378_30160 [Streptomyces viridochromogenes]